MELPTCAHDMELSINASGSWGPSMQELQKQKNKSTNSKGGEFACHGKGNQIVAVNSTLVKLSGKRVKKSE